MIQPAHLLATTDFSAPSRHAAMRAALIAHDIGATLDLLHVASNSPIDALRQLLTDVPATLEQQVLDGARTELRGLAELLLKRYGVTAGTHVASGPVLRELMNRIDALDPGLVVFGARGAGFVRPLLLGSTAERLLRKAVRPMLVVKQVAHEAYRRALLPVDFSAASLAMLKVARAFAPTAELVLLHAYDIPFEGQLRYAGVDAATIQRYRDAARVDALQKFQTLCTQAGVDPRSVLTLALPGPPARVVIEQEQEQDCDLVVIGKHGESRLEELLLGSVTKHVLAEAQSDVLVSA
jgi:nucleotide-binding universal stress UspA family protein